MDTVQSKHKNFRFPLTDTKENLLLSASANLSQNPHESSFELNIEFGQKINFILISDGKAMLSWEKGRLNILLAEFQFSGTKISRDREKLKSLKKLPWSVEVDDEKYLKLSLLGETIFLLDVLNDYFTFQDKLHWAKENEVKELNKKEQELEKMRSNAVKNDKVDPLVARLEMSGHLNAFVQTQEEGMDEFKKSRIIYFE
jgi:hypothetical protein